MISNKSKLFAIFLLLSIHNESKAAVVSKSATQTDMIRVEYVSLESALWKYLDKQTDQNAKLKKLYDNHSTFIAENIKNNYIGGKYFILNHYYEWALLENDLMDISGFFEYFRSFLKKISKNGFNERAALDFSESINKQLSIPDISKKIENTMVKQTLYYRAMMESKEHVCQTKQSAQQLLYSLYTDISLTELKGYTMMQFSWMILKIYGKGNYTHEAKLMREDFENRSERTQNLLREVMKRADRIVWRCDPPKYIKGKNYDELTRLLQGYIENEVDLNNEETCRETCGFYEVTQSHGCFKDKFCSRQPKCSGKIYNCRFFDSDMTICPAPLNSDRRYEFIEYENGRVLGTRKGCSRGTTKVDSWWRYLLWHCSYCFCICDEQGIKSDRYFNLRETVTQVEKNMVVTGLRFVKNKRIFHLQVQQGELLPRGVINGTTLDWVPLDQYEIFHRNVVEGKDYHTMNYEKRAIDLDDLMGDDPNHIVTGVRFRVIGAHLNLEVRLSEYDFNEGKLLNPELNSFWKSNDNAEFSENKRDVIKLIRPDVSTKSYIKSLPISNHNQFIEFTHTDFDKDAAQTTVPFIDLQEVTSNPPVPLSGVGVYHKGRDGFGGFIAPKLITYDYTPYVHSPEKDDI